MAERANEQPSGSEPSAGGQRVGALRLRELLASRGDAGLWLADDDDGGEALLRLYPGMPTVDEWRAFELAASQLTSRFDARVVPVKQVAIDIWPSVRFACSRAESLARRIAREPMEPAAAVAMCADVTAALGALERAGVRPVDISPADILLVGAEARLLADVGLPGGEAGFACVDLDHVAPERATAGAFAPTAQSMVYALASIVFAAIRGPHLAGISPDGQPGAGAAPTTLPASLRQVLRRGLAHSPSDRYETPAALVEALGRAIGVHVRRSQAGMPRIRARSARAAAGRRRTRSRPRRIGIVIPIAMLLAVAAVGAVAGSASVSSGRPTATTLVGGGVSVEAPRGWVRAGNLGLPPVLGVPALVARPQGPPTATSLVVTRAAGPLLAQLADHAPEPVLLGDQGAWRYRGVALDAAHAADVYVLEDGEGQVAAACLGPSGAPTSSRGSCAAALTTLSLGTARAGALGGDETARRGLARVVEDLDGTRADERRTLATAKTGRGQAAAAQRLAAAYAQAADGARRAVTVGAPGALARLVARLEETGQQYRALADAARATHRVAYAQAREQILADERALGEDLAALAPAASGS